MKSVLIVITFIIGLPAFGQKEPIEVEGGHKVEIKTSGICEMCQYTLERDLTFEKGVKEASFDLNNKVMTVIYNPKKTDADLIRKRITEVGYHADWMERDSIAYENLPFCCKDGAHGTSIPQVPTKKNN